MSVSITTAGVSSDARDDLLRPSSTDLCRVLIVDDSAVARAVLSRLVGDMPGFSVVDAVSTVGAALRHLSHARADIILLDLEMPGVHGLTGLPDLLAAGRGAKILVVSSSADAGAAAAVQALALGAADTLVKPGVGELTGKFATALGERLRRLHDGVKEDASRVRERHSMPHEFDVIAIGASTGGIHALSLMLREIPPSFEAPILVTQHLPSSFMSYFAAQLAVISGRPCEVAEDRMRVRPGRILVAPGHAHMCCVRANDTVMVRLCEDKVPNGCMPSVDPMLESVAEVYGKRGLAVMLSGMGRDGSIGARQLVDRGGGLIVQNRETSVVWGMPGAVSGIAHAIVPPDEIGRLVASQRRPG